MSEVTQLVKKFLEAAKRNPEGEKLIKERNHTFQFNLIDADPFYVEINGSKITVKKGTTTLDFNYKDWERATRVLTDKKSLENIIYGRENITRVRFDGRWDFSSRVGSKSTHMWFGSLIRMAQEQLQKEAVEPYLETQFA